MESRIALKGKTSNSGDGVAESFPLMSGCVPAVHEHPWHFRQAVELKRTLKAMLEETTTPQKDGLATKCAVQAASSIG